MTKSYWKLEDESRDVNSQRSPNRDIGPIKTFFKSQCNKANASPPVEDASGDNEDGGSRAWLFMISACFIEAFLWGFTTCYGIFLDYYRKQPRFHNSHVLAIIGTFASGIPCLGAPLMAIAVSRWPQYQRQMIWGGTLLSVGSLVGASFAKKDWQLLLSQGIGYGTGVLISYYPMLSMINTWFTARRGFAYGILFGAAGASGTGLPFLLNELLDKFGYGWTLRGYALGILVLVTPTFPFCHARPSSTGRMEVPVKPKWEIAKNPSLIIFSIANLFQGLAYYIPSLYLPSYASTLTLTTTQVVCVLAFLNAAQVIAQVLLGFISDTRSVFLLAPISTMSAAVWTLGLWFFGRNAGSLLAYSVLFGLSTGGFTSLWTRFTMSITSDKATQEFAFGLLAMQRGLGVVLAGPVATALLPVDPGMAVPSMRYRYGPLMLFVVACMVMASFGGLGQIFKIHDAPTAPRSKSKRTRSWAPPRRYSRV